MVSYSKLVFVAQTVVVAWIGCGCALAVFGDNLDPAASHRMGPDYGVVFANLTLDRKETVGLELFGLGEDGAGGARRLMLAARKGSEVVAGYLRPGKYELGGTQLETPGGSIRSVVFERHRRDEFAYFGVSAGACNWIGDYVVDSGSLRSAGVVQLTDEQSFAGTSAAFRERFPDLARRCSVRNAVIER